MIAFNKSTIPPVSDLLDRFRKVLDSGIITNNGPLVKLLEARLEGATGSRHALTVNNGTLALHLAIRALALKGEVITTPLTFVASSSSLLWEGCKPVFADVDPETLLLDPDSVRKRLSDRTSAILPVHLYGNVCDIDSIEAIAEENNLPTIYDGAMAYGSTYKGRSAMSLGHVTMLSTHAYKVLSSIEGGVLFTEDTALYKDLYRMRYFGKEMDNTEVMLGTNAKMNEINAAYGLESLEHVSGEIEGRKRNYSMYRDGFSDLPDIRFQRIPDHVGWNYAYICIILSSEDLLLEIIEKGKSEEVEFKRYFYPALNAIPYFNCNPAETPVAHDLSRRVLCLPNYAALQPGDISKVVDLIRGIFI